jgi:hypothetical protein
MGAARWNTDDWHGYSSATRAKTTDQIFTQKTLDQSLDPRHFQMRESRDSAENPNSTPLIVALDVTGSMGILADNMVKHGLGVLVAEVLKRKPIDDPHLLVMGIGDASCDRAPIQATQFEADLKIAPQIEKIFLEHGGGGNNHESYDFAWLFAASRTVTDSWDKRHKKGYLFTVGDEETPHVLTADAVKRFMGDSLKKDVPAAAALEMAQSQWNIFHVVIVEGDYARSRGVDGVAASWQAVLPQHVIVLDDHTKLAEAIVSAIQIAEGDKHEDVAKSWSGETALVVRNATRDIATHFR